MTDPYEGFESRATEVDGVVTKHPLRDAKKRWKYQFAFGKPGRRSGVWNIRAMANGDVYVNEKTTATDLKISLHKTDNWQLSVVVNQDGSMSPVAEHWFETNKTRHLHRRDRPETDDAVITGLRVMVTGHDIQEWPEDDETEDSLTWMEAPGQGEVGSVLVLFLQPQCPGVLLNQQVLGTYAMQNGQVLVLGLQYDVLNQAEINVMNQMRAEFIKRVTPEQVATYPPGFAPRAILFITGNPDELGAWDAAMIEAAAPTE